MATAVLAQPETVILFDPGLVETPESVRFDRHDNIYITNAAFPFFPGPDPRRPSLMRLRLDVPGAPLVF